MKIIPTVFKRAAANVEIIKRHAAEKEFVNIKNNIPNKNVYETLKAHHEQLARAIRNKNIALEFTKGSGLFEKTTLMKIHDISFHLPESIDGLVFKTLNEKVGHFLPENLKGKELIEYIKKLIKQQ